MRFLRFLLATVLVALSTLAAAAHAALLDTSAPFRISPVFYETSRIIQAASTANGFVVVWNEYETLEGPPLVLATRVDLQGVGTGADAFVVNTPTSGYGTVSSSLQSFPDGSFVVSWVDVYKQSSVRARRFDADSSPIGTEFVVAGPTTTAIFGATVAAAGDGSFLVVWQASSGGGRELQALRYDTTGALVPGGIVKPSEGDSTNLGDTVSASGSSDGSFVVVWNAGFTYETGAAGGYYPYTYFAGRGRVIGADGPLTEPIFSAGGQYGLDVSHLSDDGFVVSWSDSYRSYDVYPAPLDAYVSVRNADTSVRETARVSLRRDYEQHGPNTAVASAGAHGFVVAWSHYTPSQHSDSTPSPENQANGFVRQINGAADGWAVPLHLSLPVDRAAKLALAVNGGAVLVAWHDGSAIHGQILNRVESVSCGDATLDGSVSATDALVALAASVGNRYCSRLTCDADGDGDIDASDALRILIAAIGGPLPLACAVY